MIWYALCVQPSKELVAERLLVDAGFNIFVPIGHRARRMNYRVKRKVVVAGPFLPGYVFAGFETIMDPHGLPKLERPVPWPNLMRYSMIHGVIGHDGEPWPIPEQDMVKVFSWRQQIIPYVARKQRKRRRIGAGMGYESEIVSGPYAGRKVRVIEVSGRIEALYELYKPQLEKAA